MLPSKLVKGDKVYITSPSSYTPYSAVVALRNFLQAKDFIPLLSSSTIYDTQFPPYLSAPDEVRAEDLQTAIEDTSIKAIWCARGGYGMSRIIDLVDVSLLDKDPKWVIGFSDITLLHLHLYSTLQLVSVHGPMAAYIQEYLSSPDTQGTLDLLMGRQAKNCIKVATPKQATHYGSAKGKMIGGNLTLIMSAIATGSEPSWEGCILVIEDVGEYLYAVERNLIALKRQGVFNKIAGLVVGSFEGLKDTTPPLGCTVVDTIERLFEGIDIPIAMNMSIGHGARNAPFLHGALYSLEVTSKDSQLKTL